MENNPSIRKTKDVREQPRNSTNETNCTDTSPKRETKRAIRDGRHPATTSTITRDKSPRDGSPVVTRSLPRSPRLSGRGPRKLILHFDLRNTILVADSVTNVAVEQALNAFLTGATWGHEQDGCWYWDSDQPSIKPPMVGTNTYYKFLERQLVRTPSDRTELRLATGDFTLTPIGGIFRPHFERHLRGLRWDYDDTGDR